jgi:hypothetical protein
MLEVAIKAQDSKKLGLFRPILSRANYLRDLLNYNNNKHIYLVLRI